MLDQKGYPLDSNFVAFSVEFPPRECFLEVESIPRNHKIQKNGMSEYIGGSNPKANYERIKC